jgi:hypothetical protein
MNIIRIVIAPKISLIENFLLKFVFSLFLIIPVGLLDPVICRFIRWINAIADRMNGSKKCREKKRFRVGFSTEKPPHNHETIRDPSTGIADIRLVITVAPQKDICPQGNTYPRNAVAIRMKMIITPDSHTSLSL